MYNFISNVFNTYHGTLSDNLTTIWYLFLDSGTAKYSEDTLIRDILKHQIDLNTKSIAYSI